MQRGFGGFLALVMIAGIAAAGAIFTFYRSDAVAMENARATGDVLATAKAALVAYAVSRGGPTGTARPGDLPCPDLDGDGLAEPTCTTNASLLGRLPWRTLNIAEPRDAAGEILWYALSPGFRAYNAWPASATPAQRVLNSDSQGALTVRSATGAVLTTRAVAVIFAPGAPIGGQNRSNDGGDVTCPLTNFVGPPRTCVTSYLDGSIATGAGAVAGPFVMSNQSDTANDRLLYLDTSELIPALEMRVGNEMRSLLTKYRAAAPCQCYPWADTWEYSGGIGDSGQNRGRFPTDARIIDPPNNDWEFEGWVGGKWVVMPRLPQWLAANNWQNLVWYSVSSQNTQGGGALCRTCSDPTISPMLTVDDVPTSALIITPGPAPDGLSRLGSTSRRDNITLYFEDAANRDGADSSLCPDTGEIGYSTSTALIRGAPACDRYTKPSDTRMSRDRVFTVGVGGPGVCVSAAQTLINNAPCGWPTVSGVCLAAAEQLDACTCLEGARKLLRPPCVNTLNPPECEAAIQRLATCKM
jgi:hypothetical protein